MIAFTKSNIAALSVKKGCWLLLFGCGDWNFLWLLIKGVTRAYAKNGRVVNTFQSMLPGGSRNVHQWKSGKWSSIRSLLWQPTHHSVLLPWVHAWRLGSICIVLFLLGSAHACLTILFSWPLTECYANIEIYAYVQSFMYTSLYLHACMHRYNHAQINACIPVDIHRGVITGDKQVFLWSCWFHEMHWDWNPRHITVFTWSLCISTSVPHLQRTSRIPSLQRAVELHWCQMHDCVKRSIVLWENEN